MVRTTVAAGPKTANSLPSAWQLQATVFLTGEEESFRGFKPNNVFSLADHTWGAFELAARYQVLDPDYDAFLGGAASFAHPASAAREATAYGVGLNWYLNENLKWVFNYDQTSFDGGAAGGADREDEKVFLTRVRTRLLTGERHMLIHRFTEVLAALAPLATLLLTGVAVHADGRPCSTSPTTRRASCTRTTTRPSRSTGRRRPARR